MVDYLDSSRHRLEDTNPRTYTLAHKTWNNSVERRPFEVQWFARAPNSFFSRTETSEILQARWVHDV